MNLQWKVHTSALLSEIAKNPQCAILSIPVSILGKLLSKVGERAIALNDPELNRLMLRLTIYSIADPESPDYDPRFVEKYLAGRIDNFDAPAIVEEAL